MINYSKDTEANCNHHHMLFVHHSKPIHFTWLALICSHSLKIFWNSKLLRNTPTFCPSYLKWPSGHPLQVKTPTICPPYLKWPTGCPLQVKTPTICPPYLKWPSGCPLQVKTPTFCPPYLKWPSGRLLEVKTPTFCPPYLKWPSGRPLQVKTPTSHPPNKYKFIFTFQVIFLSFAKWSSVSRNSHQYNLFQHSHPSGWRLAAL